MMDVCLFDHSYTCYEVCYFSSRSYRESKSANHCLVPAYVLRLYLPHLTSFFTSLHRVSSLVGVYTLRDHRSIVCGALLVVVVWWWVGIGPL